MNRKMNTIQNIVGVIFCFILFAVSMFYAEQNAFFILFGIAGLSGVSYFVFRMVKIALEN
ncbi:hypothetical protein [Bacillus sp. N1-1]|jgi:hypothetical protein|uniref:hypothetical protein n=1 Tax=Bacillus sp. N1-1 TaxID=2682541 RepID=UPI001315F98C|nr:hypothetical protein [Bacillus sp. N1-1]QHA90874.1 hypothetical protein GNK04_05200 [Bacillus sp. N1-1]